MWLGGGRCAKKNSLARLVPPFRDSRILMGQLACYSRNTLTTEANCELHDAGISCGACDTAECGRTEAAVWLGEGGRVGHVEQFGAKFHVGLVKERGVLDEGDVEIAVGGTTDGVSRC